MTPDLDANWYPPDTPAPTGAKGRAKCRRHEWALGGVLEHPNEWTSTYRSVTKCSRCGAIKDEARSRRGRSSRARGNRHELLAARRYGGEKTGPLGGPEDIRGEWQTQVKTHQGLPPRWLSSPPAIRVQVPQRRMLVFVRKDALNFGWYAEAPERWHGIFEAMTDHRAPRLLERWLPGQGSQPRDWFVVRAKDDPAVLAEPLAEFIAIRGDDWLDLYGRDE